ncbi:MAG: M20/M25/M40 family metallo-hydrolase, partial [Bacteroidia bacterium]|nr:M20/M25/M40 family metallo-hydrolase [Bacteroidia bacterium]
MKIYNFLRCLRSFSGTILLIYLLTSCAATKQSEVTQQELKGHIEYLSSDELQGRLTGSEGDSLAAVYIRTELASYGFLPLEGDGFQKFTVTKRLFPGKNNLLSIQGKNYTCEKDYIPLGFSSNGMADAEVVFAGYGFNINTDSIKWNDYHNLDVKGKWVMILRADPEVNNTQSFYIPFSSDRDKALIAKDMGAAGVLFVAGPASDEQDTFDPLNKNDFSVGIPVFRIKRDVADQILSVARATTSALEKKLNNSRKPLGFSTDVFLKGNAEIAREESVTRNVAMVLPGTDEKLKNEYIIIGAHFDHLGLGGPGSSSRAVDTTGVHHGADDNASGVALMLELAEKYAKTKDSHKRSIICIGFSGEEMGLLGSKYFTENPGIELKSVNAMINLDMVGRLRETNVLQVSGVGTAEGFRGKILSVSDTSVIKLALSDEGYGPSDHSAFYGKNIPVLFYTTGAHLDYHTPNDVADSINYKGMISISSLVYSMSHELASAPDRLKFNEAGPVAEQSRPARRKGVTLGIMPDFAGNIKNGLRADFVTPGKPAALGGMKKG